MRVRNGWQKPFMTREVLKEDLLSHSYNEYLVEIGELEGEIRKKALKET